MPTLVGIASKVGTRSGAMCHILVCMQYIDCFGSV
jgi:hypothetical protein